MKSMSRRPLVSLVSPASRAVLGPLAFAWFGCSEPKPVPAAGEVTPVAEVAPEERSEAKVFIGTVAVVEVDSTRKSVEAYLGESLFLETEGGRLVLRPTAAVTDEALRAQAGKKVKVIARWTEGSLPSPDESYPMEPDGSPMRHGQGYQVLELVPLAP